MSTSLLSARRRLMLNSFGLLAGASLAPSVGAQPATPPPPVLADELPGAVWRGAGQMRFFGLPIYDIRLWSPAALVGDGATQALALELIYARKLKGEAIASRSIDEMRGIGQFTPAQANTWLAQLLPLFPDVQAGDRLIGVQRPGQSTSFFFNGQRRGEVLDATFTRLFFGIWLSAKSSEPGLRTQLLGGAS